MSRLDALRGLRAWACCGVLLAAPVVGLEALAAQTPALTPPANITPEQSPLNPAGTTAPGTSVVTVPTVQPSREQIGDSLSARRQYQAAIAAYAQVTDPSPALWNKMGIAYQMMFNAHDAIRCYNVSLKLDSRNAQVFNNLATVYDSLKEYSLAERNYRKALKFDSHSALILRNFGSNQLSQHKYKKGWEAYKQALAVDPRIFESHTGASVENPTSNQDRGAVHYYMARSCVTVGNPDCAILNLRLALNEGYTNPKKVAGDSAFASLRQLPAFQQLMAAQSTQ